MRSCTAWMSAAHGQDSHSACAEELLPIQMGSLPRVGSALILSSLWISQKRWAFLRKCWQSSMRVSLVITLALSLPLSPPSVQATHGESKKGRNGVMLAILGGLWVMTVLGSSAAAF